MEAKPGQCLCSSYHHRSAPINVEDIGSIHFRLKHPTDGKVHLMAADIKLGGSSVFIVLSRAENAWPFTIENDSDYKFTFYQTVSDSSAVR